jgi:hypothetical protein
MISNVKRKTEVSLNLQGIHILRSSLPLRRTEVKDRSGNGHPENARRKNGLLLERI